MEYEGLIMCYMEQNMMYNRDNVNLNWTRPDDFGDNATEDYVFAGNIEHYDDTLGTDMED